MFVIAHDIRSLHNVGAIFRNCAAFGVEKLYLTGITGTPPRKEISKVALGAEGLIAWEKRDLSELIEEMKKKSVHIIGLDNTNGAQSIHGFKCDGDVALVLGNEVGGLDAYAKGMLDNLVEIPMKKKRSLNVSVASGIALYVLSV
ncbi:MAG: TrmH family RNA methyltransferase [bacterium]|nr:TrmH family RNA methyltransferase [bacterium]MDA1024421.1 TrmH family RNA methyltransferase [bacterium]